MDRPTVYSFVDCTLIDEMNQFEPPIFEQRGRFESMFLRFSVPQAGSLRLSGRALHTFQLS